MKDATSRFRIAAGKPRPRGFTLIEVLVVVAILCILIAALVPMISKARNRAYDSQCVAKEKRYQHAYQCYSSDHGDIVLTPNSRGQMVAWYGGDQSNPPGYYSGQLHLIYDWLAAYIGNGTNASCLAKADWWIDPALWTRPGWGPTSSTSYWHYGYVTNWGFDRGWQSVTNKQGAGFPVHLAEFPCPSTTATFMCMTQNGVKAGGGFKGPLYMHDNGDYDPWPLHGGGGPLPGINGSATGTQTNVARLDGSVRTYPWVDLVEPGCHPACFSDQQQKYGSYIGRQYLWSGKIRDGWMAPE